VQEEEERRMREEEEKERLENGGEENAEDPYGGDLTKGWQEENNSIYGHGFEQQYLMQQ
jgi:hypothetical protein